MNSIRLLTILLAIICGLSVCNAQDFRQIDISIAQENINILEANPYSNDDVLGDFTADGELYEDIELHYRGAYYLFSLINSGTRRNWKVKFPKSDRFDDRREWNFNYENYIRQHLAYKVFAQAGVPVVSAENVELSVNGVAQGLYLKYEDPDNKRWLTNTFGDNDGDLYKAAFDSPGQQKYFADLTYLGANDADYFLHYRKQTNNDGDEETDYSSIRDFTQWLNQSSDEEFAEEIADRFAVTEFIDYLVIANFIANWDSYPYRPKNYFLYENPTDNKWNFIPWDLDGTFQRDGNRNAIGTTGSIYHYFDGIAPYNNTPTEPLNRPLLWRIMNIPIYRDKYCYEYKQAVASHLSKDRLFEMIDSLSTAVELNVGGADRNNFLADAAETRSFINDRMQAIEAELDQCDVDEDPITNIDQKVRHEDILCYPNPASGDVRLVIPEGTSNDSPCQLLNAQGQMIRQLQLKVVDRNLFEFSVAGIAPGQYYVVVNTAEKNYLATLQVVGPAK